MGNGGEENGTERRRETYRLYAFLSNKVPVDPGISLDFCEFSLAYSRD